MLLYLCEATIAAAADLDLEEALPDEAGGALDWALLAAGCD
jgi:hypothetical protein